VEITYVVGRLVDNVLDRSALINLRLAEDQVGQYDVVFSPTVAMMNYTAMNETLSQVKSLVGIAPRWILPASISNLDDPSLNASVVLLVIDTNLEKVFCLFFAIFDLIERLFS